MVGMQHCRCLLAHLPIVVAVGLTHVGASCAIAGCKVAPTAIAVFDNARQCKHAYHLFVAITARPRRLPRRTPTSIDGVACARSRELHSKRVPLHARLTAGPPFVSCTELAEVKQSTEVQAGHTLPLNIPSNCVFSLFRVRWSSEVSVSVVSSDLSIYCTCLGQTCCRHRVGMKAESAVRHVKAYGVV